MLFFISVLNLNTDFYFFVEEFFIAFFFAFALFFFIFYSLQIVLPRFSKKIESFLFFVNLFFCLVNLFLIVNFDTILNSYTIDIILTTHSTREIKEFFTFYMDFKNIFILLSFLIFGIIIYKLPFQIKFPEKLNLIFYFIFPIVFIKNYIEHEADVDKLLPDVLILKNINGIFAPFNQDRDVFVFKDNMEKIEKFVQEKKKIPNYIQMETSIPKIVLIIGESTNRNYMSLYDYPLNTTPRLKELEQKGNLFVFKDVISPATYTNAVFHTLLNFGNNTDLVANKHIQLGNDKFRIIFWESYLNLIDAMRFLNYHTSWFSNQEAISIWGNIEQALAQRSDLLRYLSLQQARDIVNTKYGRKDGELLNLYSQAQFPEKQNQFIVFHLMGTHFDYQARYPSDFEFFKPEHLKEKGLDKTLWLNTAKINKPLGKKELQRRAQYINAVYYNDFVVSKIMQHFENEESIVFYLSDHSQNVYDDEHGAVGHSAHAYPSRVLVEIPFMIYTSKLFQEKHPHIMEKIKKNLNKPFMTDDFIHAFMDLLNIQCLDLKPELSLFNSKYIIKDRLYGNENLRNYDQVFVRREFVKKYEHKEN